MKIKKKKTVARSEKVFIIEIDALANLHSHVREDQVLEALVRLVIQGGVDFVGPMPNLKDPLRNALLVMAYKRRIESLIPNGERLGILPIMQITEATTVSEIIEAVDAEIWDFKIYPRYRTTNSEYGVVRYHGVIGVIKEAAAIVFKRTGKRIRIHVHPEHPQKTFTNRDAEFAFIPIAYMFLEATEAILVWEHGTDSRCIPHWKKMAKTGRFYVTLTAHHLATNEDETFGDVRATCKPSIKTETDQINLVDLVFEGHYWVIAAADDAPHDKHAKHKEEGRCDCGAYTAPFLALLYAHVLDRLLKTAKGRKIFINFTSRNARKLYGLPRASRTLKLVRKKFRIPLAYKAGQWTVMSFWANQELEYSFAE